MTYIQQAINLISASFKDNWWKEYGFEEENQAKPKPEIEAKPEAETKKSEPEAANPEEKAKQEEATPLEEMAEKAILTKGIGKKLETALDTIEDKIFDLLNYSILSGEYVKETDFKAKLDEFRKILNTATAFYTSDADFQLILNNYLNKGFILPITTALDAYYHVLAAVERKLSISDKDFVRQLNPELDEKYSKATEDSKSSENLKLFTQNLSVASLDHFPSGDLDEYYSRLHWLKKVGNNKPYSKYIIAKCGYLMAKLTERLGEDNDGQGYILENSEEKDLSDFAKKDINEIYKDDFNYVLSHYHDKENNSEKSIRLDYENQKRTPIEKLSVRQIHRRIKYFKDIDKNLELLTQIRVEIKRRLDIAIGAEDKFDTYALSICYMYAANNEFSLACGMPDSTYSDLKERYKIVKQIQSETGINNFFSQHKFVKYLIDCLKTNLKDKTALNVIQQNREIINFCKDIIASYKKNIAWTRKNYQYIFQLPLDECFKKINDKDITELFIFSTIVLPLSPQQSIKDFREHEKGVEAIEISVAVFENIDDELKKNREIVGNIQSRETRGIEILAIFTAIISFVVGSLETFGSIQTPLQAALFTLSLATSFAFFILLLFTALKGLKEIKKHWVIIFVSLISTILFWLGLIYASGNFEPLTKSLNESAKEIQQNEQIENKKTEIEFNANFNSSTESNNAAKPPKETPTTKQSASSADAKPDSLGDKKTKK